MIKLASEETQAAWAEFRAFLIANDFIKEIPQGRQLPFPEQKRWQENERVLQMAFRHGFVEGSRHVEPEPQEEPKKRQYSGNRYVRPFTERHMDRKELEKYLFERNEPVELSEIRKQMRMLGALHWNSNNASAYVKTAIKDGASIVKVATGVYQHGSTMVMEASDND